MRGEECLGTVAKQVIAEDEASPQWAEVHAAASDLVTQAYTTQDGVVVMDARTLRAVVTQAFASGRHTERETRQQGWADALAGITVVD